MLEIDIFSLEQHKGSYEQWPTKSLLYSNGRATNTKISGYCIDRQYRLNNNDFFVITSYDCHFDESCELTLLDHNYDILAKQSLTPWIIDSWLLRDAIPINDYQIQLNFYDERSAKVTLSPRKVISNKRIHIAID